MQIEDLVGQEVSGICYVRDYMEIHFDGPVIRLFVAPSVRVGSGPETSEQTAIFTVIRSAIGFKVKRLVLNEDEALEMEFSNGVTLTVNLIASSSSRRELMHFVRGVSEPIDVW